MKSEKQCPSRNRDKQRAVQVGRDFGVIPGAHGLGRQAGGSHPQKAKGPE